nr:glycerol-3-phosphate 1-O-acyltransferase PlsY [uncultured Peptostreptococcus sp.]
MLIYLLVILISYFLGSISWAYIISKYVFSSDIRQYGSKNPGTTNMLRTFGKKAGVITLLGDLIKGSLAVVISNLLAARMGLEPDLAKYISALAVVCGHNWSIFMRFKGGKGVATSYGTMLVISPLMTLASISFYLVILVVTRYVSIASILGVSLFPILMVLANDMSGIWLGILLSISVIYKHRDNIRRLIDGSENKLGCKTKS